jgi:hypothetical protein
MHKKKKVSKVCEDSKLYVRILLERGNCWKEGRGKGPTLQIFKRETPRKCGRGRAHLMRRGPQPT